MFETFRHAVQQSFTLLELQNCLNFTITTQYMRKSGNIDPNLKLKLLTLH